MADASSADEVRSERPPTSRGHAADEDRPMEEDDKEVGGD